MTAETDLLPLPEPWQCETAMCPDLYTADQVRACVSSATEALRAEVERWKLQSDDWQKRGWELGKKLDEVEARAERLEELRAEVASLTSALASAMTDELLVRQRDIAASERARAERLAEALRFARTRFAQYMDDTDRAAFDAALDQETTNG